MVSFQASWGPLTSLGSVFGASWGSFGGDVEGDLAVFSGLCRQYLGLNIVMDGFGFPEGPSWRRLGRNFEARGGHFGFILKGFWATVGAANRTWKIKVFIAF